MVKAKKMAANVVAAAEGVVVTQPVEFKVTPTVGEGGTVYPYEEDVDGNPIPHTIYDDRMAYVIIPDEGMKISSIKVDGVDVYEQDYDLDPENGEIKIDPVTGGYLLKDYEDSETGEKNLVAESHENIFKIFNITKDIEVSVEFEAEESTEEAPEEVTPEDPTEEDIVPPVDPEEGGDDLNGSDIEPELPGDDSGEDLDGGDVEL